MEGISLVTKANQTAPQPRVFYIDGHKVTVKYSEQDNPAALRVIRDTLINSISRKK